MANVAVPKVGTQLLVPPEMRARVLELALIRQESAAEVSRRLIEMALPRLERAHASALTDLDAALRSLGGERRAQLEEITRRRLTFADLFDADGQPVTVLPAR